MSKYDLFEARERLARRGITEKHPGWLHIPAGADVGINTWRLIDFLGRYGMKWERENE